MVVGLVVFGLAAGIALSAAAFLLALLLWAAPLAFMAGGSIGALVSATTSALLAAREDRTPKMATPEVN